MTLKKYEKSINIHLRAPVAQLDRAFDYGSKGWGFELSRARQVKRHTKMYVFLHTSDKQVIYHNQNGEINYKFPIKCHIYGVT